VHRGFLNALKILILKPSSLGDVVQALPVLRLLKLHRPDSEIFWWISADLAPLLENDPDLSGVIVFQRHRWATPWHWGELLRSVRDIRAQKFDWVLDLQALARSALISWLAGGRLTVGLEDWREGAPGFYDLVIPRPTPLTHAVDWYLDVLKALKVPVHSNFVWMPPRREAAASVQRRWNPEPGPWIGINPGARWPNKRWPASYYAELVRDLAADNPQCRFAIFGGRSDAPLGELIASAAPQCCLDLTGRTSLPELVEWLRLTDVVVTNDTGPMHIAAALGKRVVSIFGPTEPRRTGPYGQLGDALQKPLPCAPCLQPKCTFERPLECLQGITPARVRLRTNSLLRSE